MTTADEKLAKVRGSAPVKPPTVNVLSAATAHSDCPVAMLALASRTDLDKLCADTYFEVAFGQDPQAFRRGQMFERRVKEEPAYGALIQLLREKAGFPLTSVRIENLRSRFPANTEGLKLRAAETRRLLRQIARDNNGAPNIIDGAVLTCTVAGQTAYYEADSLAAAKRGGRLHVVEIKSFPITDGRCDKEKLGAACNQAAWYVLLCRRILMEERLQPDVVSDEGFIVLPEGIGLKPTLLRQNLAARIRRAGALLASVPDPAQIMLKLSDDTQFPSPSLDPEARLEKLEDLLDTIGTSYRPDCLQDCGLARLCRSRAHDSGRATLCGGAVIRQLPGVPTLLRTAELARGAKADSSEVHVAAALARAGVVYDRVLERGEL
jgi:hypothetical protein